MSEMNIKHVNFLDSSTYRKSYNKLNTRKPHNQSNERKFYNQFNKYFFLIFS